MKKEKYIPIPTDDDETRGSYTIRQEPTTGVQKADLWIQDIKYFILRYKWLILIVTILLIVIPLLIVFIYQVSVSESGKEAAIAFFMSIGNFFIKFFLLVIGNIGAFFLALVPAYLLARKLMHSEKILFEEFNGEKMPVLSMRKSRDETIIYKDRDNFLTTLIKGKIKIHINAETFNLFEDIGEKKILIVDNIAHEVLRVYVLPESELGGAKHFVRNEDGKMTFNDLSLMDKNDIEEYVLKCHLPGVDSPQLRQTLVNLTLKLNRERKLRSEVQKQIDREIDGRFWEYQSYILAKGSFGEQTLTEKWKAVSKGRDGEPDEILKQEYLRYLKETQDQELGDVLTYE